MPFFVAAVKSSRRGRTRNRGQSSQLAATYELTQSALEAHTACSPVSEESWIKRNLKAFYTDFEPDREKSILKNSFPSCRRVNCMEDTFQSPTVMEEARTSPLSTPVLVPNGVEKSFKSRRSFSECPFLKTCQLTTSWECVGSLHHPFEDVLWRESRVFLSL